MDGLPQLPLHCSGSKPGLQPNHVSGRPVVDNINVCPPSKRSIHPILHLFSSFSLPFVMSQWGLFRNLIPTVADILLLFLFSVFFTDKIENVIMSN